MRFVSLAFVLIVAGCVSTQRGLLNGPGSPDSDGSAYAVVDPQYAQSLSIAIALPIESGRVLSVRDRIWPSDLVFEASGDDYAVAVSSWHDVRGDGRLGCPGGAHAERLRVRMDLVDGRVIMLPVLEANVRGCVILDAGAKTLKEIFSDLALAALHFQAGGRD